MSPPGSPGLARRLLAWALPPDVRDEILGDLEELYRQRRDEAGAIRPGLWHRRQAAAFSFRSRGLPYTRAFTEAPARIFHLLQFFVSLIPVVIRANVALLVYAGTADRTG